jgi:hypothetical protein
MTLPRGTYKNMSIADNIAMIHIEAETFAPSCLPIKSVRGVLCPFLLRADKLCGRTFGRVSDAQCTMWKSIHRVHSVALFFERLYASGLSLSSHLVAGSTFFRSACTGVGPIFQRIIRVPLSRGRICHPMCFGLFLPDFARPNITPGYKSRHLNNTHNTI